MAINITTSKGDEQVIETIAKEPIKNNDAAPKTKEVKNTTPEDSEENTVKTAKTANDEDEQDEFSYLNGGDDSDEDSEDDENDSDDEDEEDEEVETAPKKSGFKKRIDKLTKRNSELEYRLAQLEANKGGNQADKSEHKPAPAEELNTSEKPKLVDFDEYDEYLEALTDWKVEQAKAKMLEEDHKAKVNSEAQEKIKSWGKRVEEAKKTYKDWGKIENAHHIPLTEFMREEIFDSNFGTDIVYHLYKNPNKAVEISNLTPKAQIKAMAKLEAQLEARLSKKSNSNDSSEKITKAPNPVKPINKSSATAITKKKPEDMNYQEYKAYRKAEALKRK